MLTIRPGKAEGQMWKQFPTLCPYLMRMRKRHGGDVTLRFLAGVPHWKRSLCSHAADVIYRSLTRAKHATHA